MNSGQSAEQGEATRLEDLTTRLRPRTAASLLLWLILAFLIIALVWASWAEIDRSIRAPARVVPSSQLQVISNLEGGIVSEILVAPGEQVAAGEALIRLDETLAGAELGSTRSTIAAQNARLARLEAEAGGRAPSFPAGGNAREAEQIAIERQLYAARMADYSSMIAAANARVVQAERSVAEAQANYQARQAQRSAAQSELETIRPLVERGIEPRLSLLQLENRVAVSSSEVAAAAQAISRAQAGVAEARASLAQARQDWRSQAGSELAATQAEVSARNAALPALADRARRTVLTAPVAGRVNRVLVSTIGGSAPAGQPLVELVPSDDALVLEARVRPQDIGFVRISQPARIDITAYDSAIYGSLEGEVVTISPDAAEDERSGETYYLVTLRANRQSLTTPAGQQLPIGPGMTASVSLLGDKRSVLSYILTPITRITERAFRE